MIIIGILIVVVMVTYIIFPLFNKFRIINNNDIDNDNDNDNDNYICKYNYKYNDIFL
jgi:hypothetical protein